MQIMFPIERQQVVTPEMIGQFVVGLWINCCSQSGKNSRSSSASMRFEQFCSK